MPMIEAIITAAMMANSVVINAGSVGSGSCGVAGVGAGPTVRYVVSNELP